MGTEAAAISGRIFGTEMEYAIQLRHHYAAEGLSPDRSADDSETKWIISHYLPDYVARAGDFLSNGGRLYKDMSTLEYCTPECGSINDTVASEIAGERIVQAMLFEAEATNRFQRVQANKRVVPVVGGQQSVSWGYHENYLAYRRHTTISEESLWLLGPHLATRTLFCGAGRILLPHMSDKRPQLILAQKVPLVQEVFEKSTTNTHKPLINLRDEPHADDKKYARVHITCGDAHMSPWAARMQLGTTALVLALNRYTGVELPHYAAVKDNLLTIAQQTSADTSLSLPLRTHDGSPVRPLDIQRDLCEAVGKTIPDSDMNDEERWVLNEWQRFLDEASIDDPNAIPELIGDRVEWAAKNDAMNKLGSDRRRIEALNAQWDSLNPAKSVGIKLRTTRWKRWMPDEELIQARLTSAPSDTRAVLRAMAVAMIEDEDCIIRQVRWPTISFPDGRGNARVFELDPFETENPELTKTLEELSHRR